LRIGLEINEGGLLEKSERSLHEIVLVKVERRHSLRILTVADFRTIIDAVLGTCCFIKISNEVRIGPFNLKFFLLGSNVEQVESEFSISVLKAVALDDSSLEARSLRDIGSNVLVCESLLKFKSGDFAFKFDLNSIVDV